MVIVDSAYAEPKQPLTLGFAGDVMFGRYKEKGFRPIGNGKKRLFKRVAKLLESDFTIVNLETPVVKKRRKKSPYGTRMRFAATSKDIGLLVKDGVDGVTIANNHNYDMRLTGAVQTPKLVRMSKLVVIGESFSDGAVFRPVFVERNGWKIAYIGATTVRNGPQRKKAPVLPYAEPSELYSKLAPVIAQAQVQADLVVLAIHWGKEYVDTPPSAIKKAATELASTGVDLLVGHHPHVLQGLEQKGNTVIAYSLGNFLFDNGYTPLRYGGIMKFKIAADGCQREIVFHPTEYTKSQLYPRPAGKRVRKVIAKRLSRLSKPLGVVLNTENLERLSYKYNVCSTVAESPATKALPAGLTVPHFGSRQATKSP